MMTMTKNVNKKPLHRYLGKFLIISLGGGILGALSSIVMHSVPFSFTNTGNMVNNFFSHYSIIIADSVLLLIFIISLLLFIRSKKEFHMWDQEDPDYIQKTETTLNIVLLLIDIGIITSLIFFSTNMVILGKPTKNIPVAIYLSVTCILYMLLIAAVALIQRSTINLIKDINPEKNGDPLDFNFQKKWMKSCDEFERQIVYKSAYKAYQVSVITYIVVIITMLLVSSFVNIGPFPFILVGGLWLIQAITYSITSIKITTKKHKHQKGKSHDRN